MILSYSEQKTVIAAFVGQLCQLITDAGGKGVADLASTGEEGWRHMKLFLGREFGDPDLHYVQTPLYKKQTASRVSESIPVQLPSTLFAKEFDGHEEPPSSCEPNSSSCNFDCEPGTAILLGDLDRMIFIGLG